MNSSITGRKIAVLRKAKGWTQKELADKLHVTDKAVSKWERGLNFPDLALLEPISVLLEISLLELLDVEQAPMEVVVQELTQLSAEEKKKKKREIRNRAWLNFVAGWILWAFTMTALMVPDSLTWATDPRVLCCMSGLCVMIVSNAFYMLIHDKHQ